MAKLIRIDKNGTKYWMETKCPRCGGTGYIDAYQYVEGGICFMCDGSGYHATTWKEYTPEYAQKLEERRLARAIKKAPEKNAKFLKDNGFSEDGKAWIVLGNTYEIKDELKEAGAKWNNIFGWHFDHETEYDAIIVTADEIFAVDYAGVYRYSDSIGMIEYIKEQKAKHAPKTNSEYIGEIGDKVEMILTFKDFFTFETHYSYYGELNFIYKFADNDGNTIIWKTGKDIDLEHGEQYKVKGTIKDHKEYKGDKQTILTRCKVAV